MTFWSGEKLRERLPALITDDSGGSVFDPAAIDCSAYRLAVGNEVYISPTVETRDRDSTTIRKLADGEAFAIPPGQFAFLVTRELVHIPQDAIAFISMRATIKWRGLVNVSGFHVDPGFQGQLTFAVFNAGPSPVHLKQGDDWFLIWFADLDRATELGKAAAPSLHMRSDLVNSISGPLQSLEGLSGRIDGVEKEQGYYRAIAGFVLAVAVGVFLKSCLPNSTPLTATTLASPSAAATATHHLPDSPIKHR